MSEIVSEQMSAIQAAFIAAQLGQAGFFFPYELTPENGLPFHANVWSADPRGRTYARAVAQVPELAHADVRFLTLKPGDPDPGEGARIPFEGGTLVLHFWAQVDPMSGESIGAAEWRL